LRDAEVGLLREQVWKALDHHLADRERLLTESHEAVAALEAKLGTSVTVDRPALRLLADTLNTANTAWHQVANSEARLDQCRQDAATTLDAVIKAIAPVMQIEPTDLASAAAELEAIKQRCARLTETENRLAELRQSLDLRVNPSLERIERDRAEMIERYEGRGIEEIEDLIRQYPAWLDARDAVQRRQEQFDIAANRLTHGYELDAWPIERVQAEINECRQIGERATDTNQEIGRIENKIEQAKRSDKIATAWNRVLELREALLTRRNEQMLKSVGRLILDDVRRETRDANLPLVARRARELFTLFTHGRYELRTNPGPSSKFSAFDTQLRIEQSLDQLSSATRVQLLIAVRMAFVETQESDVLLPMIFDETLANADSLRADALINTTLEIAANGRQVFYFTAQYDEVQKWEARAGERGIDITIIDLAEARDIAERERPPAVTLPLTKRTHTPHPGAQTRAEYRLTLAVPQLDLWSDDVGAAHLWYLIDDLNELHQLIDSHNVTTWGQVMNYGASGMATLGIDAVAFARLAACADALRALLARMQVGRGKPVTFADLQASGGLTSTFEKHCRDLLEEVNGDGKLFIQLLEAKRIGGFRVNQIDKFREYFEDNGHLVAGSPLTSDQIRPQVVRQCERAINAGEIDLATIDRLLDEAFPAGDSIVDLAHTVGVQASLLPSGE
jgi:hypothetical protein